jgi:hypothetical protein
MGAAEVSGKAFLVGVEVSVMVVFAARGAGK